MRYDTLKRGSTGKAVEDLQLTLDRLGYPIGNAGADGIFGKATESAVRQFQQWHSLTVDGIAGQQTQTALYAEYGAEVGRLFMTLLDEVEVLDTFKKLMEMVGCG